MPVILTSHTSKAGRELVRLLPLLPPVEGKEWSGRCEGAKASLAL